MFKYNSRDILLPCTLLNPWSYSLHQLKEHLGLNAEEHLEVGVVLSQ